jgi:hypothetical protein
MATALRLRPVSARRLGVALGTLLLSVGCSSSSSSTNNNKIQFGDSGSSPDVATSPHDSGNDVEKTPTKDAGHADVQTARDSGRTGDAMADATGSGDGEAGSPCGSAQADGPLQQEVQWIGAVPASTGGTIVAGTYVLEDLYYYPDVPEAGLLALPTVARKTLVLETTTYSFAQAVGTVDAGVGAAVVTGGTYVASGTSLTLTQSCPTSASVTYSYSATSTILTLASGSNTEEYRIQPAP